MLLRSWKVPVITGREHALQDFSERTFLPVLQNQAGCLGVYLGLSNQQLLSLTLWQDHAAIHAFEENADYLQMLTGLCRDEYIVNSPEIEVWPLLAGCQHGSLALRLAQLSQPSLNVEELA